MRIQSKVHKGKSPSVIDDESSDHLIDIDLMQEVNQKFS